MLRSEGTIGGRIALAGQSAPLYGSEKIAFSATNDCALFDWRVAGKRGDLTVMQERFQENERYVHPRQRTDNICVEAVRWSVNAALWEDDREKAIGRSLYSQLLWEMAKAASNYALAKNIDLDEFETQVLSEALIVIRNFRWALVR